MADEPKGAILICGFGAVADTILYGKRGAVAIITLNRPKALNAYNVRMRDEFFEALEAVRDDPDARAAVICGAGERAFCAGADLTEFGSAPSQAIARQVRWERDVWGLMAGIRKPLVAAMRGYVIGSGVEIACLCDVRVAADDAVFAMPEVALGMIPAAGGTQTLRRAIGTGRAMEMILTNRRVGAAEAKRIGLAHRVTTPAALMDEALALAAELAGRDGAAMAAAKQAVLDGMDMPLAAGLELESRLAARLAGGLAGNTAQGIS